MSKEHIPPDNPKVRELPKILYSPIWGVIFPKRLFLTKETGLCLHDCSHQRMGQLLFNIQSSCPSDICVHCKSETFLPWVGGISQGLGRKMGITLKGVIEEDLMKGLFIVKVKVKGTGVGW